VRIDCGDAQHVNKAHPSLKSSSGCQTQASGYKILDTMTAWTSASSFKQLSAPVQDSSTADASVPFPSLLIEPHWDGLARINIWKAMRESYSVESELQLSEDSLLWQDPRQETLQLIKENCQDDKSRFVLLEGIDDGPWRLYCLKVSSDHQGVGTICACSVKCYPPFSAMALDHSARGPISAAAMAQGAAAFW
jgi:hypothetical protein